jgi:hypothetical protein
MDQGRFEAWTRRRMSLGLSGLMAGLVSLGTGRESAAKKKPCPKCPKPKPTCPQRVCCSCDPPPGDTFRDCRVLDGEVLDGACDELCRGQGGAGYESAEPIEGWSTFCDINQHCVQVGCAELR